MNEKVPEVYIDVSNAENCVVPFEEFVLRKEKSQGGIEVEVLEQTVGARYLLQVARVTPEKFNTIITHMKSIHRPVMYYPEREDILFIYSGKRGEFISEEDFNASLSKALHWFRFYGEIPAEV